MIDKPQLSTTYATTLLFVVRGRGRAGLRAGLGRSSAGG